MQKRTDIQAVIFDLGGVLIDFDFQRAHSAAAKVSGLPSGEVQRRLFSSPDFLAFERGSISEQQFHVSLQQTLGCSIPYEMFCMAWSSIFKSEVESTIALARSLTKAGLKVGILSNTNVLHFKHLRERMSILRELEHVYASHEIGSRKPEPESFQHVLSKMNVAPQKAVFVDDLDENIAAARALGMIGIHATGADAVRSGITELGLL
ncbi:MAG TPA: HAD family phosphatase [Planctomycetota bacterium]|nr:HAD family phosphatase [Planctomycetota bacterium]